MRASPYWSGSLCDNTLTGDQFSPQACSSPESRHIQAAYLFWELCVYELPPSGLRQVTNWWKPWEKRDLEVRNSAWCLERLDRGVVESEFPNRHGVGVFRWLAEIKKMSTWLTITILNKILQLDKILKSVIKLLGKNFFNLISRLPSPYTFWLHAYCVTSAICRRRQDYARNLQFEVNQELHLKVLKCLSD